MDKVEIKAENAAKSICHDLHEGYVPGCGRCLSLMDTEAARSFIKESILQEFREYQSPVRLGRHFLITR